MSFLSSVRRENRYAKYLVPMLVVAALIGYWLRQYHLGDVFLHIVGIR